MKPLEGSTHIGDAQTLHAPGRIGRWRSTTSRRKFVPAKMPSSDAALDFPPRNPLLSFARAAKDMHAVPFY